MYTKEDIIIWSDDKRIKLGQEYYFGSCAKKTLDRALNDDKKWLMKLRSISREDTVFHPFVTQDGTAFPFMILKKEPKKKFAPYDFSLKEDRDALIGKRILNVSGNYDTYIIGFMKYPNGDWVADSSSLSHKSIEMLTDFVFADTGEPVGKVVESEVH